MTNDTAQQSPGPNPEQVCKETIAAVIVAFNPDTDFGRRLNVVLPQVARVIIVDNASLILVRKTLADLPCDRMDIIENRQNVGIATGLNQGVKRAAQLDFAWVLTLDQDTDVDPTMVSDLWSILSHCPVRDSVGILGSNARSKHSGRLQVNCTGQTGEFIERKEVTCTGSLMSVPAYEHVGPFRDDFFMDGVDLEYCLRLRRHGFKILTSCKPFITHAPGKGEEHRLLGRVVLVANLVPLRYYYRLRNLIQISRSYLKQERTLLFSLWIKGMPMMFIKILFWEDNKLEKYKHVLLGIRDGMGRVMRSMVKVPRPDGEVKSNRNRTQGRS
jgi:rhamnosyltransferase